MNFESTFKNKSIVITGHTGFKGSWLTAWLISLGAKVTGISLEPNSSPSHFNLLCLENEIDHNIINIEDQLQIEKKIISTNPDFVFHLAAQSIVTKSYLNPIETWRTNVIGTVNLLNSLRGLDRKCVAIIITSDKCYENNEWEWGYREIDKLGGVDPYSASKASAELAVSSFARSFFMENSNILLSSSRAGNVIGGGDWSMNRIVPDCVRSWSKAKPVELRNPNATRPWQHVLEPLSGYLLLAKNLSLTKKNHGQSFNFGPSDSSSYSVLRLVEEMSQHWDKVSWKIDDQNKDLPHESGLLKLNIDKAATALAWQPNLNFKETVKFTVDWYKSCYEDPQSTKSLTFDQIEGYCRLAKERKLSWTL